MNILIVDKRFPNFGGVAVVTSMLSKKFTEDGHRVIVATLMPKLYDGIEELTPSGVTVIPFIQPYYSLKNISFLRKILIDNSIDVIINQWALHFEITYIINRARKGIKTKYITELHGAAKTTRMLLKQEEKVSRSSNAFAKICNRVKLWAFHEITKWSVRYVCRNCDKYILLSPGFIPELVDYARLKDSSMVCAIGNAIAIPKGDFKYDSMAKEKKILYVGRMDYYNKCVHRIIQAWEQIYKTYPEWTLDLVGEGPQLQDIKDYVVKHEIDRVNFHKFTKEPPTKHYLKGSILMLTSDLEGFGLVIIEGMQFGVVPIVYGSYVAIYDILENGKDGFITPTPFNMDYTIERMKELMDDENKRMEMAVAAEKKAEQFSLDNIIKKWYNLF